MALQLMNLIPDILFKLLREYLSFEDKLESLMDLQEFRPYLEQRSAWITCCPYLSLPFLDLIRTMPRGWYVHRDNWSHRLWLQLDPYRMTLSFHHFLLDTGLSLSQCPTFTDTCLSPLNWMLPLFRAFLEDYVFLPHMKLSLYYLKHYGLVMIQSDYPDRDQCKIRFYDWEEYIFSFYQPIRMKDASGVYHFNVMLTDDYTLRVECLLTAGHCHCEQRRVELLPVSWQVDETGYRLKTTENTCVPVAGVQVFQMADTHQVQSKMTYFLSHPYPDMQVEVRGAFNQRLKI